MSDTAVLGFESLEFPRMSPSGSRALFLALFERMMEMDLSEDLLPALAERLLMLWDEADSGQLDDSWRQWFDFCASFRAATPARSYQDILDDDDRR